MISHKFETETPRPKIGSESKIQNTAIEKMKLEECGECNLKLHSIGTLPAGKRLTDHKRIKHRAECENCGKRFVSTTHVAVHKFLAHDIECSRCGKTCEGHCLEPVTNEIEEAGEEEMKIAHKNLKNIIENSEKSDNELLLTSH